MLSLVAHLPLIMAAEKSRTAFYIVGGITAAWAVILALAFGLRRPDFPADARGQRIIMTISAVLVIATGAIGVITASKPSKSPSHSAGSSGYAPTTPLSAPGRGVVASQGQATAGAAR